HARRRRVPRPTSPCRALSRRPPGRLVFSPPNENHEPVRSLKRFPRQTLQSFRRGRIRVGQRGSERPQDALLRAVPGGSFEVSVSETACARAANRQKKTPVVGQGFGRLLVLWRSVVVCCCYRVAINLKSVGVRPSWGPQSFSLSASLLPSGAV